jgi:hypothetical protein
MATRFMTALGLLAWLFGCRAQALDEAHAKDARHVWYSIRIASRRSTGLSSARARQ